MNKQTNEYQETKLSQKQQVLQNNVEKMFPDVFKQKKSDNEQELSEKNSQKENSIKEDKKTKEQLELEKKVNDLKKKNN
jgi:hypothetical protein